MFLDQTHEVRQRAAGAPAGSTRINGAVRPFAPARTTTVPRTSGAVKAAAVAPKSKDTWVAESSGTPIMRLVGRRDVADFDHLHDQSDGTLNDSSVVFTNDYFKFDEDDLFATRLAAHVDAPLIDQAKAKFVASFVTANEYSTEGHFSYLPTIYNDRDGPLPCCVQAVGLATLYKESGRKIFKTAALVEYVKACRMVNVAFGNSKEAKSDSTLLSIMLLGSFETTLEFSQKSLDNWIVHIRGASDLLLPRGTQQLLHFPARRMCVQMMSNIVMSCIQLRQALPDSFMKLRDQMRSIYWSNPWWRISEFVIRLANYWALLNNGKPLDPWARLQELTDLDNDICLFQAGLPPQWKPWRAQYLYGEDIAYEGRCHLFCHADISHVWLYTYLGRLVLNVIIVRKICKAHLPGEVAPELKWIVRRCKENIIEVAKRICATIPQSLGRIHPGERKTRPGYPPLDYREISSFMAEPTGCPMVSIMGSNQGMKFREGFGAATKNMYRLHVWPLFLVGHIRVLEPPMRSWALGQLLWLAREKQSELAAALAERLMEKGVVPPGKEVPSEMPWGWGW